MREIEFRAKEKYGKQWVYGMLCYNWEDKYGIQRINDTKPQVVVPVLKETIGQFTGRTDKNDKKIFEGDIIKGTISSAWVKEEIICEVRFINDGYYCVEIRQDNVYQHKLMFSKKLEIIGNIYDNPELLEVEV